VEENSLHFPYSLQAVSSARTLEVRRCAICERTLLVGERPLRFAPHGARDYVDVCALCREVAIDHGWVREGSPLVPSVRHGHRRRALGLAAIFGGGRRPVTETLAADPALRRLSRHEQASVEAVELFNASDALRTVEGIARSLGEPQVSVVVLSGTTAEVVITLSWEISWYQYRVSREGAQPVKLAERGLEPEELDAKFTAWNARFDEGTGVQLDLENLA
jgi:hypothetical protein